MKRQYFFVLFGFLLVLSACSSINCPLNNRVVTVYRLAGDVVPLADVLTISTTRTDGKLQMAFPHEKSQAFHLSADARLDFYRKDFELARRQIVNFRCGSLVQILPVINKSWINKGFSYLF